MLYLFQVENEYGAFGYGDQPRDKAYLRHLADKMKNLGISELLFTSDSPAGTLDWGSIPDGNEINQTSYHCRLDVPTS